MKIGFIKHLIEIVENSNINELEITRFGTRIRISKTHSGELKEELVSVTKNVVTEPGKPIEVEEIEEVEKKEREDNLHTITSPMVGTVYKAPAPDAPPYIEEGDHIKKGDVVCIIEAMKIMNEIESDVAGEVLEVLVGNEEPVEYNQGLFIVRKT